MYVPIWEWSCLGPFEVDWRPYSWRSFGSFERADLSRSRLFQVWRGCSSYSWLGAFDHFGHQYVRQERGKQSTIENWFQIFGDEIAGSLTVLMSSGENVRHHLGISDWTCVQKWQALDIHLLSQPSRNTIRYNSLVRVIERNQNGATQQ